MVSKIVIADDEEPIRGLLRAYLERSYDGNVEIYEAPNGEEALRIVASNPKPANSGEGVGIDLLLTDMNMPIKNRP